MIRHSGFLICSLPIVLLASAFPALADPSAAINATATASVAAEALPVVTVALDGSGDFKSLQAAIDAAPKTGEVIRVKPGTYLETIVVDTPGLQMRGVGSDPSQVVVSAGHSALDSGGTGKSYTMWVKSDDFFMENMTVENTYSRTHELKQEGSQAVALRATGDRQVFSKVRLLGYQDTLYADSGTCHTQMSGPCAAARQYYADCYIEGHVDFIFGDAKAVFENCEIRSKAHPVSHVTAQSRKYAEEDSGYVFNHCKLTADPGADAVYLGRPWRWYATVVFMNCSLGKHIVGAGWQEWPHDGKNALPTVFYAEYNSSGPGANPKARIPESKQLTAAEGAKFETKAFLAGTDHWDPTTIH